MTMVSATQAWAILARHARDEIAPLRLQELCRDTDRVSSLVTVYNTSETAASSKNKRRTTHDDENRILLVDLSRQRMTIDTINHLMRLSTSRNVKAFIQKLAWGQNNPNDPVVPKRSRRNNNGSSTAFEDNDRFRPTTTPGDDTSPSMHLALRAPAGCGLVMLTEDGHNALHDIHYEWERIEMLSDSIRRGKLRGVSGSVLHDVLVVGSGVPVMALRFIYQALLHDKTAHNATTAVDGEGGRHRRAAGGPRRRLRFHSSVDPIASSSALSGLDPNSTIVFVSDLQGNEEVDHVTRTAKSWLLQGLGTNKRPDLIFHKHLMLCTGNKDVATGYTPESVFLIPEHSRCEAFTTFTPATLLPLSIVFGWKLVEQFLSGAHDMDTHFVETNPRHNLPVLLALSDVWNDKCLGSAGRVVTPFTESLSAFPSFVAALEAQTCGRKPDDGVVDGQSCCAIVTDGGLCGVYDRALYQSGRVASAELVMTMDTQATTTYSAELGLEGVDGVLASQDALMCSLFAHADTMAFGTEGYSSTRRTTEMFGSGSPSNAATANSDVTEGNRPSSILMCGKCDAFTCGQLVALSEHRAVVKAHLLGVDPFVTSIGSSLRTTSFDKLKEELQKMYSKPVGESDDENDLPDLNLSTSTILGHYANLMRDQRIYTVKS